MFVRVTIEIVGSGFQRRAWVNSSELPRDCPFETPSDEYFVTDLAVSVGSEPHRGVVYTLSRAYASKPGVLQADRMEPVE